MSKFCQALQGGKCVLSNRLHLGRAILWLLMQTVCPADEHILPEAAAAMVQIYICANGPWNAGQPVPH